jgi:hypothetical protein
MNMKRIILWLLSFLDDGVKLELADQLLTEVLESNTHTINNVYAEHIITTIIKSQGNKIQEFIVKD